MAEKLYCDRQVQLCKSGVCLSLIWLKVSRGSTGRLTYPPPPYPMLPLALERNRKE